MLTPPAKATAPVGVVKSRLEKASPLDAAPTLVAATARRHADSGDSSDASCIFNRLAMVYPANCREARLCCPRLGVPVSVANDGVRRDEALEFRPNTACTLPNQSSRLLWLLDGCAAPRPPTPRNDRLFSAIPASLAVDGAGEEPYTLSPLATGIARVHKI